MSSFGMSCISSAIGDLKGYRQTFFYEFPGHGAFKVQSFPNGARCCQEIIGQKLESHNVSPPALA